MNKRLPIPSLDFTQEDLDYSYPVKVPTDNGIIEEFTLGLMSAKDDTEYDNARARSISFVNGQAQLKDLASLAPLLISFTLKDTNGKLVPKQRIGKFPAPVQTRLFEAASIINKKNAEIKLNESVEKVFGKSDSPVDLNVIKDWLSDLDSEDEDVRRMQLIFFTPEDTEETVKNSLENMMDGSG